jgi:hypothetical protein
MGMAMGWKDWLAGCSLALTGGVLAGALHGALSHPAEHPSAPTSGSVVLPAPEDNAHLTRQQQGSAPVDQRDPVTTGRAGASRPAAVNQPADKKVPPAGKPAAPPAGRPPAGAPARPGHGNQHAAPTAAPPSHPAPTDSGPPPAPGSSGDPDTPSPTPQPTGTGSDTDPAQPPGQST